MLINADKPHLWKSDVDQSIDFYNDWFIRFAPETYRTQRRKTTSDVLEVFKKTANLTKIDLETIRENPGVLSILRMATAPPLARDRLMGLAHVGKSLIKSMEGEDDTPPRLPKRMPKTQLDESIQSICDVLTELLDDELLAWIPLQTAPTRTEITRAATVIADRKCGAATDPIIRNEQEKRQLSTLEQWLECNGYEYIESGLARDIETMPPGTFTFRLALRAGGKDATVMIPIDCVVKPLKSRPGDLPVLIEAKSAGDFTNTNKRRKEEAQKHRQLKEHYGNSIKFVLFLCGYFEPGYLGYEAAEGIDWIWEHRLSDLEMLFSLAGKKKAKAVKEGHQAYAAADTLEREENRARAQVEVDSRKGAGERNRLGQFSTPFALACQIVTEALRFLPADAEIRFLEPAVGTGAFFSALLPALKVKKTFLAVGCEIDPAYGKVAQTIWERSGLHVSICDFIDFACDMANFDKFTLLCTNPPYVRHHHMSSDLKVRLQSLVTQRLNLQPSGLSGLYVYFLLMADALLADGAVASWLLPAEFLYVNYGKVIREYLTSRVTLLSIHHFDPDEVQFDDALVSSCVVTYRKTKPAHDSVCSFMFGGDLVTPRQTRAISLKELRNRPKWTIPHFDGGNGHSDSALRIKDLVQVRRGVATGANDFFIIDKATATEYEIPHEFLKPILTSPRHLGDALIEANLDGTPQLERFGYLVDCTLPPDEVKRLYPGLWSYFERGIDQGVPSGYLCAQREVWYFQERRAPAPFLASYMGRSNGGHACPIRFFANFSSAIVTNVFLNLYPLHEFALSLAKDRSRMIEFVELLNSVPGDSVLQAGRAYGGGLHKVEPNELSEIHIQVPPEWLAAAAKTQLLLV